jgi:hypothetical protein
LAGSRSRSCCATAPSPPIAQDRIAELPDGRISLQLKTPWADGTTHVVYEPLDLIAKLAALVPRPYKNLILYHGVLAAKRRMAQASGRLWSQCRTCFRLRSGDCRPMPAQARTMG